jgi:hypothetical protein
MRKSVNLSLLLVCIIAGNISVHAQEILHNAIVYTVDETNPWSDAIAIDESGIIMAVGNFSDVLEEFPSYELTDLQGQLVLPGFQDAHLHAVEAGINGQLCYVESTPIDIIPYWFDELHRWRFLWKLWMDCGRWRRPGSHDRRIRA